MYSPKDIESPLTRVYPLQRRSAIQLPTVKQAIDCSGQRGSMAFRKYLPEDVIAQ
jgi:hypothetical protein